ncbi:MAG: hypothetical protein V4732_14910 [Pseudomonadota bacterium]
MGLRSRNILLEESGQTIEVRGKLATDNFTTILELHVNGELQDSLESTPKNGFFGCKLFLNGSLNNNVPVSVQVRANALIRPEYTFFVNGKSIYVKKGTWGGL